MAYSELPTEDYEAYRAELDYFETADGKIAYLDKGDGPVVLLVHGVPTSSWLYVKVANDLLNRGFRVIAPDLLGYGASDKPEGYELYHQEKQGGRLLALMDYLGVETWTHVCHDVGGLWTWEMLSQSTGRVERLVILNTIMFDDGFKPPMRFKRNGWAKFYTWLYKSKWGSKMMMKATLKNGLSKNTKVSKARMKGFYKPMQEGGNRAIYHFFTQTCHLMPDYSALFDSLEMPVHVIWGAQDPMLVWEPQKDLVKVSLDLDDENITVLEESVHFIQEEEPEVIAEVIEGFVME